MNENIGSKGGNQDRKRRYIIIKKKKKKKMLEEKDKLDRQLRRIQIQTFIKIIPLVIVGGTFQILTGKKNAKPKTMTIPYDNIKNIKQNTQKKQKVEFKTVKQDNIQIKTTKEENITVMENVKEKKQPTNEKTISNDNIKNNKEQLKLENKNNTKSNNKVMTKTKQVKKDTVLPIMVTPLVLNKISKENNKKTYNEKEKTKIKKQKQELKSSFNFKLIEAYQYKFREVNYELKKLLYEYQSIEESIDNANTKKEIDELFNRLNLVLIKLEELKNKIKVDDIKKYDDNYIYYLIDECMDKFDNKKTIKGIKESELYILLSSKIEELNGKKNKLTKKLSDKKQNINLNEEKITQIRKKQEKFSDLEKKLIDFEKKQDEVLEELEEKIKNSDEIKEKINIKLVGINKQSNYLLNLMALQMMTPGLKNMKNFAITAMVYVHFMKKSLNPKYEIKKERYQIIEVTDYKDKIQKNLDNISEMSTSLDKTSNDLDKIISNFKTEYGNYLNEIPGCMIILNNLLKVRNNLEEKKFELKQIEKKHELILEKNNAKVKKLNNKQVM